MASNEIIVRIVVDCAAFTIGFITTILAFKLALARSAAAHKRELAEKDGERKGLLKANESLANDNTRLRGELAAKDDERLTIVANYENVIAAKDAEIAKLRTLTTHTDNSKVIAELQRRLRVAEEFATEMKQSTNSLVRACGHQMILRLQGEGGNNEGK